MHCDEMFEVIQSVHEKGSGHSGVQKTFEMVSVSLHYSKLHFCLDSIV